MSGKEAEPIGVPVDKPSTVNEVNDALMQIGRFGDGRLGKMEVDYTAEVDKQIPEANLKAKVNIVKMNNLNKISNIRKARSRKQ
jgi:hypothetical protein